MAKEKLQEVITLNEIVSAVEFYKASSGGKLDPIDSSVGSLHNRRSILIRDDHESIIWIIQGSGAAASTKLSGEMSAKKMNASQGFTYLIKEQDYESAEEFVQSLLDRKIEPPKSKETTEEDEEPISHTSGVRRSVSKSTIPQIPKIPAINPQLRIQPKGDENLEQGPEIKEFQISYYQEEEIMEKPVLEQASITEATMMRDVLLLVHEYINQLDNIINSKPEKNEAQNILSQLSDKIVDLIYQ